jgi:hypothetical protein
MSNTNNERTLTVEQRAALKFATDMYCIRQTKLNGGIAASPVILMPQFEEDTDGKWVPIESNGIRPTKKDGYMYVRFGMAYKGIDRNGKAKIKVMKTNMFDADTDLELLLETYDMTIGSALPDTVLIIEETVEHPGTTLGGNLKGGYQQKFSGDSNIPCTFTGTKEVVDLETGEVTNKVYKDAPIFRRIILAEPGSVNVRIKHTNTAELSKFASAAWQELNSPKAQSAALKGAAAKAVTKK